MHDLPPGAGWLQSPTATHKLDVLPRQWVVERIFARISRCRELSTEHEILSDSSETVAKSL